MKKAIALFFTAGLSDLKFVSNDGVILELAKKRYGPDEDASIREIHEALLKRKDDVLVWPFDEVELPESRNDAEITFLKNHDPLSLPQVQGKKVELLKWNGRLVLAATKFKTVWKKIIDAGNIEVVAIVGLGTKREGRSTEPVAAEEIIFHRVVDVTKPTFYSELANYVEGDGRPNAPFSTASADKIEAAVRRCRRECGRKVIEPWVALTGGIPQAKAVVRAAVELHFGPTRSFDEREEGTAASFIRSPQDSFVARRQALTLVRRGAFIEAAAAALPFKDKPEFASAWGRPLRCTARLLDGNPIASYAANAHPENVDEWEKKESPPLFLCNLAREIVVRGAPQRRCLLVGIRAEAALRAERWADALNLTVSFFDSALKDGIECKFGLFDRSGRQFQLRGPLTSDERRDLVTVNPWGDTPTRSSPACMTLQSADKYRYYSGGKYDEIWCRHLPNGFEQFRKALDRDVGGGLTLKDLRNVNVHDILTDEQLNAGKEALRISQLWSAEHSFLKGERASDVLADLKYAAGARVFDEMIAELEKALLGDAT